MKNLTQVNRSYKKLQNRDEVKLDNLQNLLSSHGIKADVLKVEGGVVSISPCEYSDFLVAKVLLRDEGFGCQKALVL